MNRIIVISLLMVCIFCCSGCFEVGYKTEVTFGVKNPFMLEPTPTPVIVDTLKPKIVDYDYPTSTSLEETSKIIKEVIEEIDIENAKQKFGSFKN